MLKSRIIELLGTIPLKSTIYTGVMKPNGGKATGSPAADVLINRRAHAILDPAFPWQYAKAFAELNQRLPAMVDEPCIRMAYQHLSGRVCSDDITEVQVFQHPKWKTKRGFLEALLLLPDLQLNEVAAHTGLCVSVVMTYASLFWNVRDRLKDELFVNEICYPETRLVTYRNDYWDTAEPRDLMLGAAFRNDLATVLQIFGSRAPSTLQTDEFSAKQIKTSTMADAEFIVRAGGAGSKIPVLAAARRQIVATEKNAAPAKGLSDSVAGLTAISWSPGDSISATVEGLIDNSDYHKLVAAREAREAAAKKTEHLANKKA